MKITKTILAISLIFSLKALLAQEPATSVSSSSYTLNPERSDITIPNFPKDKSTQTSIRSDYSATDETETPIPNLWLFDTSSESPKDTAQNSLPKNDSLSGTVSENSDTKEDPKGNSPEVFHITGLSILIAVAFILQLRKRRRR